MKAFFAIGGVFLAGFVAHEAVSSIASSRKNDEDEAKGLKIISPKKDLSSALKNSAEGDIFIYGGNGYWHHIDKKDLQNGTRVFVLGSESQDSSSQEKK